MSEVDEQKAKDWSKNMDFLQAFLDASPNGVMIFDVLHGKAGQIVDFEWRIANLQSAKLLERKRERLLGQQFLSEFQSEEGKKLFNLAVDVIQSATSIECESDFGGSAWFIVTFSKLQDSLIITLKDISLKKQIQAEIESRHEELDRFFNLALDLLIVGDTDGYFIKVNKTWENALGYNVEELVGQRYLDFIHPDDLPATDMQIQKLTKEEPVLNFVNRYRTIDGSYRHIEWRAQAFDNLIYGAGRDITESRLAEGRLRESERQFRSLFEQSNDAVFILNTEGRHLHVNQKASELLGYSVEELQSLGAWDISAEPDKSDGILSRMLAGEIIKPYERVLRHKDGSLIPAEINVEMVRDEEGRPLHIQSVVRDIRDRKRNEFALNAKLEEELLFQEFLKSIQDIVIELSHIQSLDDFFRRAVELGLERFSFERISILLYEPPFAVGTYGTDKRGKVLDERGYKLDSTQLTSILIRAIEREERFVFDEDAPLFSLFQPIGRGQNAVAILWNGTEKLGWVAVDNAVEHRPISKAQLEILALYALSLGNLLAQKQTQLSLEESEEKYRSVVAALAEGIVVQNADGIIMTCNEAAERILGLSKAQMLGRTSLDPRWRAIREDGSPFPGEEHPTMMTLKTGQVYSNVIIGIHKPSGELTWISINSQPLIQPNESKPYAVVATLVDITRRKKAERQVLELQLEKERMQVLSNFIQGTSHEFRTPLAIIKSNAYLLKRLEDPEKRAEKASSIEIQIERILGLLLMLNKMSQLDSNITMKLKQCRILYLVENLILEQHTEIERNAIQISVEGEEGFVLGNEEYLTDAFRQVLRNAIQFSPDGGKVKITGLKHEQRFCLSIEDEGIGIADDILLHIFERFYRLDIAHSTAGFGLGLPLAQSIIERHDGEIVVESELGKGSRFEIWLPLSS